MPVSPPEVLLVPDVEAAVGAGTLTPMPRRPFIPAAACPGTEQRYSYLPVFVSLTVSVAD